jgi:hypothetical protein
VIAPAYVSTQSGNLPGAKRAKQGERRIGGNGDAVAPWRRSSPGGRQVRKWDAGQDSVPQINGWEATRRLKADPATMGIPILAVTAQDLNGSRALLQEAGFCGYVGKPILPQELVATVKQCLQ